MSNNGQFPAAGLPSVSVPMGDRRPMYGPPGPPLALSAPQPLVSYPDIPPPIQPTVVAPPPAQPALLDEVPVANQAMILDGLRQSTTIETILSYFPALSAKAIWALAAAYQQYVWDGAQWIAPPPAQPSFMQTAPQQTWPTAPQPPQLPVAAVAVQSAAPQAPPAPKQSGRRVTKNDYEPIRKLRAAGKDSSTIAQELGISPDSVMRAFKKLDEQAAPPVQQALPAQEHVLDAPALANVARAAANAINLQVGQTIPGQEHLPPLERDILRARGLDVAWGGAGWLVVDPQRFQTTGPVTDVAFWALGNTYRLGELVEFEPPQELIVCAARAGYGWQRVGATTYQVIVASRAFEPNASGKPEEPLGSPYGVNAPLPSVEQPALLVDAVSGPYQPDGAQIVPVAEVAAPAAVEPPPVDYTNPIGAWLDGVLFAINQKLEKHGLRAELRLGLDTRKP